MYGRIQLNLDLETIQDTAYFFDKLPLIKSINNNILFVHQTFIIIKKTLIYFEWECKDNRRQCHHIEQCESNDTHKKCVKNYFNFWCLSKLKVSFFQKVRFVLLISQSSKKIIPNNYPELEIWIPYFLI